MLFDIAKHRSTLVRILKDLYSDVTLASLLGFKGGTAAHLFYDLDRFSVDLDFDLLQKAKEEYVFERVREILSKHGTVKSSDRKRFTFFYLLAYETKEPREQNIKVEINRRDFGSSYNLLSYLGISMQVMTKADMFAHKLIAMQERMGKSNRDIYDVHYFLKQDWDINPEIIAKRTGTSLDTFLRECVNSLEQWSDRNVLAGIGELLDNKQKAWVKAHLKEDTIFFLRLKQEQIIAKVSH